MKNKFCYLAFLILLFQVARSAKSKAKCKKPNGYEGDVKVDGCEQLTCTKISGRKGIWIPGPAMWVLMYEMLELEDIFIFSFRDDCCVYNGTLAPVDTEMDYFSPDNGCTHVNS